MQNQTLYEIAYHEGCSHLSKETGFIHYTKPQIIPLYENFCYCLALFDLKSVDKVLEGRELLLKLLNWQLPSGNFPRFFHEFPNAQDFLLGLKIAPLFFRMIEDLPTCLGQDLLSKVHEAFSKIINFSSQSSLDDLMKFRLNVLKKMSVDASAVRKKVLSSEDLWQFLVTSQFLDEAKLEGFSRDLLFYPEFNRNFLGHEPEPNCLDWISAHYLGVNSRRLQKKHPLKMHLSAFRGLNSLESKSEKIFFQKNKLSLIWGETESIHSFTLDGGVELFCPETFVFDLGKSNPFLNGESKEEISFYMDASPDVSLLINQSKGSCFFLGDTITIRTTTLKLDLSFSIQEGKGSFLGLVRKGIRKNQLDKNTYDWNIVIECLSREESCSIKMDFKWTTF
jgi:hypothetical protein